MVDKQLVTLNDNHGNPEIKPIKVPMLLNLD